MLLCIERFSGVSSVRNQSDAPGGIAASSLKISKLLNQPRLARAKRALMQCVNMIEHPHRNLQPVSFHSAKLLHLEPQIRFFGVARTLHELREPFQFGVHAL